MHLAGQKVMCFDPTATIEVPDFEGSVHNPSLRYGYFQRTAAALAGHLWHEVSPGPVRDAAVS